MSDFLDACDKLRALHADVDIDLTPCPDCGACPAELRCQCDSIGIRKQRELDAARASEAMLREALEAIRRAYLTSANYSKSVYEMYRVAADTLDPATSGEWMAKHDADKDGEIERISAELTEQFSLLVRAKSQLHASEQESVRLSAQLDEAHADSYRQTQRITALEARVEDLMHGLECMTAKAQEHLAAQYKAEAERDGLVVRCHTCHGTVIFKRTSEGIEFYHSCQSPESFARITTEARRKALLEAAALVPPSDEPVDVKYLESYMRGRQETWEFFESKLMHLAQEAPDA